MYARKSQFVGWRSLEMFAFPSRECDMFYQDVQGEWCKYGSVCAFGNLTPVVAFYVMD